LWWLITGKEEPVSRGIALPKKGDKNWKRMKGKK